MADGSVVELDNILSNRLMLPNGREVEIAKISTTKAVGYLRRLMPLFEQGNGSDEAQAAQVFKSFIGMADIIEDLGTDLGIKDELMELEIEETLEVVRDFFGLLLARMMAGLSRLPSQPPSPST